jgi:protein Mpv17
MFALYKSALATHPVATKAVTAGTLMMVSDIVCQSVERQVIRQKWIENDAKMPSTIMGPYKLAQHSQHDWIRTLQVGVTGLTFSGPISHFWYQALDRVVRMQTQWINVGTMVVLDAALFSPMAVAGYFVCRSMLEGAGVDGTYKKLQTKWRSALVASWSFWPAANVMYVSILTCISAVLNNFFYFPVSLIVPFVSPLCSNFAFVPLPFRVVYNNSLSLGWNFYLSQLNSSDKMMSHIGEDYERKMPTQLLLG